MRYHYLFLARTILVAGLFAALGSLQTGCSTAKSKGDRGVMSPAGQDAQGAPKPAAGNGSLSLTMPAQVAGTPTATLTISLKPSVGAGLWSFPFVPGTSVAIPDLLAGAYTVEVSLLDAGKAIVQQGSSQATIVAGQTAQVTITLHAAGQGGLTVVVVPPSANQCGPALGMPNYVCPDGKTLAGPGACELQANGKYGWAVVTCPASPPAGEHCGGNTATPHLCPAGYTCLPEPGSHLPFGDVGGVCQVTPPPAAGGLTWGYLCNSESVCTSTAAAVPAGVNAASCPAKAVAGDPCSTEGQVCNFNPCSGGLRCRTAADNSDPRFGYCPR